MKYRFIIRLFVVVAITSISCLFSPEKAQAQGIPFYRNFSATEYHAHNRNFDILCDEDGFVFIANFEGLLYYDNVDWHIIHTPSITRITSLFRDSKGTIWVGGYNYIGYVEPTQQGCPALHNIASPSDLHGEVQQIWEKSDNLWFLMSDGKVFCIKEGHITYDKNGVVPENSTETFNEDIVQAEPLDYGIRALVTNGNGLVFTNDKGNELFRMTEQNGLCSNNISHISYNGHGLLWGATDNGIFAISFPSIYTHFTENEGLKGEVTAFGRIGSKVYVGTRRGLYALNQKQFKPVNGISHACWEIAPQKDNLLVATADGVYRVNNQGNVSQLSTSSAMSVMGQGDSFYSGELDGVYLYDANGKKAKASDAEKVVKILKDKDGTIWLQNLYGRIWKSLVSGGFAQWTKSQSKEEISTIVDYQNQVIAISSSDTKPFPYPTFSSTDSKGITWLTDSKGKCLYAFHNGNKQEEMSKLVYPLMDFSVQALMRDDKIIWMGGDKGINLLDYKNEDPLLPREKSHIFIRSIILQGDSIVWGGYSKNSQLQFDFSSSERHITINYSIDYPSLLLNTQYRFRLNGGSWSTWDFNANTQFINQAYGQYLFEVQARDHYGRLSDIASIKFTINPPFYRQWYMMIIYIVLFGLFIYAFVQLRLRQLNREKLRLESIVQERTTEVVKQKNEIEEKSKSLEKALDDLSNAQHELIRQEKMATAGKLTQGLIDRILNPLNYINNFAKLSEGLAKDIKANIEDEKENMSEDNYEDTMDVLDMLIGNLQKVSEHGQNNTRILKAMEEMLKDRSGGIKPMDLVPVLNQDEEMTQSYFAEKIKQYGIKVNFNIPQKSISINGNPEQLSMTLMSMLGNSIYAVVKKAQREKYEPEVSLSINIAAEQLVIAIRDNGIGIEETIINKIFDPFFTTKPTGEAAGVGLYLSREIIQNHGGDISVKSEKDVYTEFTITLPISQN